MLLTKLKTVTGLCLAVVLVFLGTVWAYRAPAADKLPPSPPKESLADTLILLDKQWWEAASKHDVDTLGKILADDWIGFDRGIFPSGDSPRWTKAASLQNYPRWRFTEVQFVKEREVFRIDEHTALMIYEVKWRAEDKDRTRSSGHSRYVRCWVQRDGGWFVKHTECVNISASAEAAPIHGKSRIRLGARASSSWEPNTTPDKAFDGNRDTFWNSGGYAPAWIEADLNGSRRLGELILLPAQDITGATTHEVWVSNEPIGDGRTKAKLVHTFRGETKNKQPLRFEFSKGTSARYIQVRTTQSPTWIAWWEIEIQVRDQVDQELELPIREVGRGGQELRTETVPGTQVQRYTETVKPPARPDAEALQGTWQVVAIETNGKEEKEPWLDRHRQEEWVVKDRFITIRSTDPSMSGIEHSKVFALRPDKLPKEIDLNAHWAGMHLKIDIEKGIYTLDGDLWKVCLPYTRLVSPPKEASDRPKVLATKEGSSTILITLKRKATAN
jgi:uncharacterized protein (TIGR03067 family)